MATEILAVNTTTANSADVVVADGDELTVCLKDAAGPAVASGARVEVRLKDDAGEYFTIDRLDYRKPALVVRGGTWQFGRMAGGSCGVFSA